MVNVPAVRCVYPQAMIQIAAQHRLHLTGNLWEAFGVGLANHRHLKAMPSVEGKADVNRLIEMRSTVA